VGASGHWTSAKPPVALQLADLEWKETGEVEVEPSSRTTFPRLLTSTFAERRHRWSALGLCQVRQRLGAGAVHTAGELLQLVGEQAP
jgi:hypothetical protein